MPVLAGWIKEKRAAYLYRMLSDVESGTPRQLLFLELAQEADAQAKRLAEQAQQAVPIKYAPDRRAQMATWLIHKLGPQYARPVLAALKMRGLQVYDCRYLLLDSMPDAADEMASGVRRPAVSGKLRAAVFGAQEGLFALTLLVLGMAGAIHEFGIVLLTGVAGLLAGALCVAAWEYRSACKLHRLLKQHKGEPVASAPYPWEETQELAKIYQARGMERAEALTQAVKMTTDTEFTGEPVPLENHGLYLKTPSTPREVAFHGFFGFLLGGALPLSPYLLNMQHKPLLASMTLSAFGLLAAGAAVSALTGRQPLWGSFRMFGIGGLAGLAAYWTGQILGSSIL